MIRFGVTEKVWDSTSIEKKLQWRFFLLTVSFLSAPFTCRSDEPTVNWVVAAFAVLMSQSVVETQRHLTKIENARFRKGLLLAQVAIGVYAVIALGTIFLGGVFYHFTKGVFPVFVEMSEVGMYGMPMTVVIAFVAIALGAGIFRATSDLQFKEMLYYLPKSGLQHLLIRRRFVAGTFIELFAFEVGVHFVIFYYIGMLTHLVRALYRGTFL